MALEYAMKDQYIEWHKNCIQLVNYDHEVKALEEDFQMNMERLEQFLSNVKTNAKENNAFRHLQNSMPMDMVNNIMKHYQDEDQGQCRQLT